MRHPIYSGFMLATLGTALILGEIGGLISVALIVIAWGYKAHLEEAFMIEQFGNEYEDYRHTVKGLIPGIWQTFAQAIARFKSFTWTTVLPRSGLVQWLLLDHCYRRGICFVWILSRYLARL